MNKCLGCGVCCNEHVKIDVLNKPFGEKCINYCDGQCSTYDSKPTDCSTYQCIWSTQDNIDIKYRPDKLGVVFEQPLGKSYWVGIELEEGQSLSVDCMTLVRAMNNDGAKVMIKDKNGKLHYSLPKGIISDDFLKEYEET